MHKNWRIDILLSCYSFQENHPTFTPHTLLFSGEIKCMYLNLLLFVGTRWAAPRTPLNKPWHKNKYLQERKEQLSPMMKELDPHIPVSVCITVADPGFSLGGANSQCGLANLLLPPANVVCEGYVFTGAGRQVPIFSYFFLFFSAYSYFSYFLAISSYFSYFLAILLTISKYLLEI